ncbi:MAG TPA: hypothetical protein VGF56_02745 [Rhizomicrobium sp.]
MSKDDAAGRKTEDAFEAEVAALQERIDIQKARLCGEEPPPQRTTSELMREAITQNLKVHTRVPGDGFAPDETPAAPQPIVLPREVFEADSTKAMLNAQLLECVGLIRQAAWLYRNSPIQPHDRGTFINQTVNIMEASTKMGDAIRRLGGGEDPIPTTRHVMVLERGEGGRASLENE